MTSPLLGQSEYIPRLIDRYIFSCEILQDQKRSLIDKGLLQKIFESYQFAQNPPPDLEQKIETIRNDIRVMQRNIRITLKEIANAYAEMHTEDRTWCDAMLEKRHLLVDDSANSELDEFEKQLSKIKFPKVSPGKIFDSIRSWFNKVISSFK